MDQISTVQKAIFNLIKEKLPPNISLVNEIAEILELGNDSAYRRIRGEKPLTIEELFKLKIHFNLSIDAFCGDVGNHVTFETSVIEPDNFKVSNWVDKIFNDLIKIDAAKQKEITYVAKDPPLFHYFQLPEIAAFKVFFWEKTLFQFPEYEAKTFNPEDIEIDVYKKGQKALALYSKIPTVEIWNENTFRILLSQIEYYWISGFIVKKSHLKNLLDKMEKWIQHMKKEAELGFKFLYGHEPVGIEDSYKLYFNEVVYNDNTILVKTDRGYSAYLTFNVLSLLNTTNQNFCKELDKYFKGLVKKSTLISHTGEKERNRFFNDQLHALDQFRQRID
ncbi:MAG: hypothetical protein JXR31_00870 [Prolixibacteraceae bacterium]|nr:hypothetical protein [Prolixibacteraceae bacterium]MBN2772767.1 hypothetical protein [Prolixibacteraceae bacterium]